MWMQIVLYYVCDIFIIYWDLSGPTWKIKKFWWDQFLILTAY